MSSERPLHVVIRIPYKRPPGFVEPPTVVWTDEMEQKLWEILTINKRQNIDWNAASKLLNVPVPYLLRYAAFLYETQLRDVQMQLRLGEALSASNISTFSSRNRASSLGAGSQRPASVLSNASREQYVTSRGANAGSQEMVRTGSNNSLSDGRKPTNGSTSSIAAQPVNEVGSSYQSKNPLPPPEVRTPQAYVAPSPPPFGSPSSSRRLMSTSSSVSTITTTVDPVSRQPIQVTPKQETFPTTNLSTIESQTTNSYATPAASLSLPLSKTLSNSLSPLDAHELSKNVIEHSNYLDSLDEDYDSMRQSNEDSLSEQLARLQVDDVAAFLPFKPRPDGNKLDSETINPAGAVNSLNSVKSRLQPTSKQTLDHSSSCSDEDLDLTQSELEVAYLEDTSTSLSTPVDHSETTTSYSE
ncbi:14558_t:CDS:2 [Acaulospora morrowiae]|uniref:Autophagy-related protein 29 n=1 Tax=Acaulospora morrowiae TaxID=94023 RepID=A0A9N9F4C9_9GLOM|nr:14558_t:CDS:2 [Acaulospora morrowiae]